MAPFGVLPMVPLVIFKDVNGYSNIHIRSEYLNTISEFEYSHLFSVPAFFVIFSSPEPLGSQGELIVYPLSRRLSFRRPS